MSEEQQEMFRRGLSTQLQAKLSSAGETHDLAKIFNKGAIREIGRQ